MVTIVHSTTQRDNGSSSERTAVASLAPVLALSLGGLIDLIDTLGWWHRLTLVGVQSFAHVAAVVDGGLTRLRVEKRNLRRHRGNTTKRSESISNRHTVILTVRKINIYRKSNSQRKNTTMQCTQTKMKWGKVR